MTSRVISPSVTSNSGQCLSHSGVLLTKFETHIEALLCVEYEYLYCSFCNMSANIFLNDERSNKEIDLPVDVLANHVIPFVGVGQYRFVAVASRRLREAYCLRFPTKKTFYNMSTMKTSKICWDEASLKDQQLLQRLAKVQRWYYHVVLDDLNDEDWDLLRWTKSIFGCSWGSINSTDGNNPHACAVAARNGNLRMLQCLRANGCPWNGLTCYEAARNGHLEVLKWARDNGCPWYKGICRAAAGSGNLEVLKFVRDNGCPWSKGVCRAAAASGNLEVLKFVRTNGCPWNGETCNEAARRGDLEMLKWAHSNGCPFTTEICKTAAAGGNLEVLKFVRTNGCPWNETTCNEAAQRGDLEMLKWAHDNGCPWDSGTCNAAATGGHLEVLKFLRANGCPWNYETFMDAAFIGDLKMLKWAL
jgi:hypothetical protein